MRALARDITRGVPFLAALAQHPYAFGALLYCQLVSVGEVSGALPAVLARLADDRERAASQRAKLRAVLAYPVMVLLLSLAITADLLIGVVPTFKTIFDVEIAARLRNGERLAAAMRALGCFPQDIVQPIAVAEESGSLDAMLLDLATLADCQVDLREPLRAARHRRAGRARGRARHRDVSSLGNVV